MTVLESVVGAEGRVSLPAAVRKRLGLEPGDVVSWVLEGDGQYRLTTAQALAEKLWASNKGESAGNSEDVVREQRETEETRTRHTEPEAWAGARPDDDAVLALLGEVA